jgi:hypothetical protein
MAENAACMCARLAHRALADGYSAQIAAIRAEASE